MDDLHYFFTLYNHTIIFWPYHYIVHFLSFNILQGMESGMERGKKRVGFQYAQVIYVYNV
jgi:hypothetical protein